MLDALAFQAARKLQDAGRFDEARKAYRQILARNPKHVESYAQLALLAFAEGKLQDALKENERALKLTPDVAGLYNNHGSFQLGLGRFKEAVASFERAVQLDPRDAQARNNLGGALSKLGRLAEALASMDAALAIAPGYAKAFSDRAMVLTRLGRLAEAIESAARALSLRPDLAEAHDHRGVALLQMSRTEEALAAFEAAIAADPDFALAHRNRAVALEALRRDREALSSISRALALDPDLPLAPGTALQLRLRNCDWDGLEAQTRAVLARIDAGLLASPPFTALFLPSTPGQQRVLAGLYAALVSPLRTPTPAPLPAAAQKIRLGYFSADFGDHPVTHALAGVLEHHDRARFEITAFLLARRPEDAAQSRVRAAVDRFVDLSETSDHAAAALAREAGIEIAVDLTGYTSHGRPGIFTYGAAPTQVSWLGYPGTLANASIPYVIADDAVIPARLRANYAERLVSLPHCFFPTDDRRPDAPPPSRASAGLPDRGFVFCSFNSAAKITPSVFDIWMRVLAAVDASVLWLGVRGETAQANLRREAGRRGIAPERLVFAPLAGRAEHFARQRLAGLFLDTAPFGAHSTAADTLQAGLPLLTVAGDSFSNRVAASLLQSLAVPELVAADWSAYEKMAIEIGRDPARAAGLKETLAANLARCPTFDTGRYTRTLERAFAMLARRARDGLPPQDIAVPDTEADETGAFRPLETDRESG